MCILIINFFLLATHVLNHVLSVTTSSSVPHFSCTTSMSIMDLHLVRSSIRGCVQSCVRWLLQGLLKSGPGVVSLVDFPASQHHRPTRRFSASAVQCADTALLKLHVPGNGEPTGSGGGPGGQSLSAGGRRSAGLNRPHRCFRVNVPIHVVDLPLQPTVSTAVDYHSLFLLSVKHNHTMPSLSPIHLSVCPVAVSVELMLKLGMLVAGDDWFCICYMV